MFYLIPKSLHCFCPSLPENVTYCFPLPSKYICCFQKPQWMHFSYISFLLFMQLKSLLLSAFLAKSQLETPPEKASLVLYAHIIA